MLKRGIPTINIGLLRYLYTTVAYMRRTVYMVILLLILVWPHAAQGTLRIATGYDKQEEIIEQLLEKCSSEKRAGELFGKLYIKERIGVFKNNLLLNTFPGMARFDKETKNYVTELFYEFYYTDYGITELRRKSYNTSFRHGSGEIKRITDFVKTDPRDPRYLREIFSPLSTDYSKYYTYRVDSATTSGNERLRRISFKSRFSNIRLLDSGWVWFDDSCRISEFHMKGWDEQSRFEATYTMERRGDDISVVNNVHVDMDYDFVGNKLNIVADALFDYSYALPINRAAGNKKDKYNLTGSTNVLWDTIPVGDKKEYARQNRKIELDEDEKAILGELPAAPDTTRQSAEKKRNSRMWDLGDKMISSHSYSWDNGGVKLSPIIDLSHIDYSSSRGLSYKLSMNITNYFDKNREIRFKPQIGYNFKQKALYWNIDGRYLYNPTRQSEFGISVGEGTHTYSSAVIDRIKAMKLDSLDFERMNLRYFRNLYLELLHKSEISNGVALLTGLNFHRREMEHNPDKILDSHGVKLKDIYSQFAPHLRITWQPGMYYYMDGNRKVNIGSRYPTVSWDVEQGINGVLGANSIYTRSELDVQYKMPIQTSNNLYMRFGAGGYFYTKDVYFVDYTFLKSNNLPLERSEELGGVFQLLDSEWYNAAKKYLRANFTYETTYHSLQKLLPRIRFLQNEYIYYNILFLSQLSPYMELGYGVATPYLDMGLFVSSQNGEFHRIGYKISFSLFSN